MTAGDFWRNVTTGMWFSTDGSLYLLTYDGYTNKGYGDQEAKESVTKDNLTAIDDMQGYGMEW